jgi:hypothetical protein
VEAVPLAILETLKVVVMQEFMVAVEAVAVRQSMELATLAQEEQAVTESQSSLHISSLWITITLL